MARQLDGATPQPVRKMDLDRLLHFVVKQQKLAGEVHTCYEAGAFGYYLHRKLEAMGVSNLVVQPQDWDERGKGVMADHMTALLAGGEAVFGAGEREQDHSPDVVGLWKCVRVSPGVELHLSCDLPKPKPAANRKLVSDLEAALRRNL